MDVAFRMYESAWPSDPLYNWVDRTTGVMGDQRLSIRMVIFLNITGGCRLPRFALSATSRVVKISEPSSKVLRYSFSVYNDTYGQLPFLRVNMPDVT